MIKLSNYVGSVRKVFKKNHDVLFNIQRLQKIVLFKKRPSLNQTVLQGTKSLNCKTENSVGNSRKCS